MEERPITLSVNEVRMVLSRQETMIHRPIRPSPEWKKVGDLRATGWAFKQKKTGIELDSFPDAKSFIEALDGFCPHCKPGDVLWVREPYFIQVCGGPRESIFYKEEDPTWPYGWTKPSLMPRFASRFTLYVISTTAEYFQNKWIWNITVKLHGIKK